MESSADETTFDANTVVPALCTVTTLILFASSSLTCRQMQKQGSTGGKSHIPIVAMMLNCLLWATYGQMKADFTLILVNVFGLASALFCVFVFWTLSKGEAKKELQKHLILSIVFVGGLFSLLLSLFSEPAFYLGIVSSVVTVLMFGSPLLQMVTVIATQSTQLLSFPLTVTSVLCTLSWSCYGWLISDPFVLVPNAAGFALAAIQLGLFAKYPSKSPTAQGIDIL